MRVVIHMTPPSKIRMATLIHHVTKLAAADTSMASLNEVTRAPAIRTTRAPMTAAMMARAIKKNGIHNTPTQRNIFMAYTRASAWTAIRVSTPL